MWHKFIFSWLIYFAVWVAFTTSFDTQELVTGAGVSFIISLFTFRKFTERGFHFLHPVRIFYIIIFLFVFLRELIKANFHVAWLVVQPRLPIAPGIVRFKTELNSDIAKLILANSITLTPGTLSVDIVDNTFYIHWLEVGTTDDEQARDQIALQFESILKKIF